MRGKGANLGKVVGKEVDFALQPTSVYMLLSQRYMVDSDVREVHVMGEVVTVTFSRESVSRL